MIVGCLHVGPLGCAHSANEASKHSTMHASCPACTRLRHQETVGSGHLKVVTVRMYGIIRYGLSGTATPFCRSGASMLAL